ncbi:MAG: ribonuclease P protein component [Brachybacterium sp.]|nr:ribonuclease P protein component [Brachybacterium sp.]
MRARHRLRSSQDFRRVPRQGVRSARSHVVVHLALLAEAPAVARVGFVVSGKVGNSVVRHRVTRRLRAIMDERVTSLPTGATCVVRALPGIQDVPFADLTEQVDAALAGACRKLERRAASLSTGTDR